MFQNLSPQQKKLLAIGAPLVAVIGLYMHAKNKNSSSTAPTGALPAMGNGNAVDTGQLVDYESSIGNELSQTVNQLQSQQNALQASLMQAGQDNASTIQAQVQSLQQSISTIPGTTVQHVNSASYPVKLPSNADIFVLGNVGTAGYEGSQIGGGAPVYANVGPNGMFVQDFGDVNKLPAGTTVGTLPQFSGNVGKS